jgi:hypothetical protein
MSLLLSKPVVVAQAGALNYELPEFDSVSRKLTPDVKGEGSNIQIYVNRPSKVWKGQDEMPEGYKQDQEKRVDVYVHNYSAIKSLGTVEKTADIIDQEEQVIALMRTGIQRELKTDFLNSAIASANTIIRPQNPTTAQPISWGDVSLAISRVLESGVCGSKITVLGSASAFSYLLGAAASNFWSQKAQDEIFNGRIRNFDGADLIKTIIPTIRPTASGLPSATAAAASEGDKFITVAATTSLIPAGTMFTIDGVYALDLSGNNIYDLQGSPVLAVFATPLDVPAGSTAIPLGKSIFVDTSPGNATFAGQFFSNLDVGVGGGAQFVSSLPANNAAITQVNGAKNCLVVYSDLAMAAAAAAPAEVAAPEQHVESRFGVSMRTYMLTTPKGGKTDIRMDTIAGFSGVYSPGACALLF